MDVEQISWKLPWHHVQKLRIHMSLKTTQHLGLVRTHVTETDYWEEAELLLDNLRIPVYGIGAGVDVDGQLTICSDLLGLFQAFTPKFIKKYENLAQRTVNAFAEYVQEVRNSQFPEEQHTYKMVDGEYEKLAGALLVEEL